MDDVDIQKAVWRAEWDANYETDNMSLCSTESSNKEDSYTVEAILAEGTFAVEDASKEANPAYLTQYLVKWEGYPIHRCKWPCPTHRSYPLATTWEPEESFLDDPSVLEAWAKEKANMSDHGLQDYCDRNEAAFERAKQLEEVAREVRLAKRIKRRRLCGTDADQPTPKSGDLHEIMPYSSIQETVPPTQKAPEGQHDGNLEQAPLALTELQPQPTSAQRASNKETSSQAQMHLQAHSQTSNGDQPIQNPQQPEAQSPSTITTSAMARRTQSGTASKRKLNTVNQGGASHIQRKQSSSLYTRVSSVRRAKLRSQEEGVPDFGSLNFLGAAPQGLNITASPKASNDVYGRRELPNYRSQMDTSETRHMSGLQESTTSSNSYGQGKVPLVCPDWRYSNNCQKGPEKCEFLHCNQDANGNDYPVAEINRSIPPKYWKLASTCLYWLENASGCTKTSLECKYAHYNTGFKMDPNALNRVIAIDKSRRPVSESIRAEVQKLSGRNRTGNGGRNAPENYRFEHRYIGAVASSSPAHFPKSMKTCFYWSRGSCRKRSEDCLFAHHDTGIIADPPLKDQTCRAWKKGEYCSELFCKMAHRDTGILSGQSQEELRNAATNPMMNSNRSITTGSSTTSVTQSRCSSMLDRIEAALKVKFVELFERGFPTSDPLAVQRIAFLAYHPQRDTELIELLTRYLMMHEVEVCNTWYTGSWDHFKNRLLEVGEGIIIATPDYEWWTMMPGIGQVLQKRVRLWSVGKQNVYAYRDLSCLESVSVQQECVEIFPTGGFIYITDEVFENQPQLALMLVQLCFAKIAVLRQKQWGSHLHWMKVNDAQLSWRLCVRPELMEYLYRHCETHSKELNEGDPAVKSRADLYAILKETNYIEQDDPVVPVSRIEDKYPIISLRQSLCDGNTVDYFNSLASSQQKANYEMICYFAGLQVHLRHDYRHFYVVHTEPDAPYVQEWKDEIQTIVEVMTPERCVAELAKDSEDSIFDFLERYMDDTIDGKGDKGVL